MYFSCEAGIRGHLIAGLLGLKIDHLTRIASQLPELMNKRTAQNRGRHLTDHGQAKQEVKVGANQKQWGVVGGRGAKNQGDQDI